MEAEVYALIKSSIKNLLNIDLNHYKDEQMKRRLDSWLVRSRASNWKDYLRCLGDSADELEKFRNYLTINVTEFFRDLERWNALRRDILPKLLADAAKDNHKRGGLRVWSAGCSTGVEAYTLAILLEEAAPGKPHAILATDMDHGALAKARARGPYHPDEMRNLNPEQRSRYITPLAPYCVKESLARMVTFREQNLLNDPFDHGFDLIVCRNVIIYFTNEAKALLYRKFHDALRPGGIIFLGGTEIMPRPGELGFCNAGISFYTRD
ncbi:MAG: protein-glutamate O-methyltransferase CheR [Chloroflexota bacterium]|jgi:chemotaxis protein methyltransferase CheR